MAHKATAYTVRVRRKGEPGTFLPLGNIDGNGTYLLDVLADYLTDLESFDADQTRSVRSIDLRRSGDELYLSTLHGQTGMAAEIVDKRGELLLRQSVDDTQHVRCGCLIRLPASEDMGFLATHVNNGRAVKGLLEKGIQARFREQFDGLVLTIKPFVEGSVYQDALEAGRLLKLKLIRVDRAEDPGEEGLGKWIEQGTEVKEVRTLSARGREAFLRARLPLALLRGDGEAIAQILQFDGQTYDQARLEVELPSGKKRTFTIGDPDAGHAIFEDLRGLRFREGEPTDESIWPALQKVIDRAAKPRRRR